MSKHSCLALALLALTACAKPISSVRSQSECEVRALSYTPYTSSVSPGMSMSGHVTMNFNSEPEHWMVVLDSPCGLFTVDSKQLFAGVKVGQRVRFEMTVEKYEDGRVRCVDKEYRL